MAATRDDFHRGGPASSNSEDRKPQQLIAQFRDVEDMLRAGYGHVKQAELIVVRHRVAIGTAQAEIVGHLDPLPFEALGAADGRDHMAGGAFFRRALRRSPQMGQYAARRRSAQAPAGPDQMHPAQTPVRRSASRTYPSA
jgi:hypothetical protein